MIKIFPLLLLISLRACSTTPKAQSPKQDSNKIVFIVQDNWTVDSLAKYKIYLLEKDIEIDFSEIRYNENNIIEHIRLKVDCKDGNKGSASNLDMPPLQELHSKLGFFRDYSNDAKIQFQIGFLRIP